MMTSMFCFFTRSEVLLPLVGNSYDRVSVYMSAWTTATAAIEFLINPTIGQLSDCFGRKKFLLLAPYANILLKSWVVMQPSIVSLTVERIICDGLRTLAGSTLGMAMATDIVDRSELAQTGANMSVCLGIGLLASPIISSFLSPIGTYKAAVVMAIIQLLTDTFLMKESLRPEDRKPSWSVQQPFAFAKLFTKNKQLTKLATVTMLHNMVDIKVTADPILVFQMTTLGWSRQVVQRYQGIMGLALLFQGKVTQYSLKLFGLYNHTSFCHFFQVARGLLLGFFPTPTMQWVNGVLGWVAGSKEHAVKQLLTGEAIDAGFGRGELSGLVANLRALMVVIASPIFGRISLWGRGRGFPGAPLVAVTVFTTAAELVFRSITRKAAASKPSSTEAPAPVKKATS
jgi:DHA1 family tetracycline resistance protein-like MFS transporter